jgi:hypothetical protein
LQPFGTYATTLLQYLAARKSAQIKIALKIMEDKSKFICMLEPIKKTLFN